jgi:hypothetical protein
MHDTLDNRKRRMTVQRGEMTVQRLGEVATKENEAEER